MGTIVTVNFRGDELYGFKQDDGVFLAAKPMVEAMGLDWNGQYQRMKRDPILSEGMCMMHIPFGRGGSQEAVCIKMELVNGWLFTIDTGRIKDEAVRERVILYQRECYQVLHDHFAGKKVANVEGDPTEEMTLTEKMRLVEIVRQGFGIPAFRQAYFKLDLPRVPAMYAEGQNDLFHYGMVNQADAA